MSAQLYNKENKMKNVDIAKAWKDKSYFNNLSIEQQKTVPASPIGSISLSEDELRSVSGGGTTQICVINTVQMNTASSGCCRLF